jgi:hypothetical protein
MAADYQLIQEFETVSWRDMIGAFQPVFGAYIWPEDREFPFARFLSPNGFGRRRPERGYLYGYTIQYARFRPVSFLTHFGKKMNSTFE